VFLGKGNDNGEEFSVQKTLNIVQLCHMQDGSIYVIQTTW